jgi:two-component system, OmpR family, sensor kinase
MRADRTPDENQRRLEMLEQLLSISTSDLRQALAGAADLIASELHADKVDAFLHDPSRNCLVAIGSSHQPLSALERKHGLDVLPISNGGRVVWVFETGKTFLNGQVDEDPEELRGIKEALGIRSKIGVALDVGGVRRGMIMIASQKPKFFTADDARFAESMARWVGLIAHRAELAEETAKNAVEQGRRSVAEELVTVLAHDLRNFIFPVDFRLNQLRRRAESERRDNDLRELNLALKGLHRVQGLIGDILDVARIDQGVFGMQVEPVDLIALARDVVAPLSTPEHEVEVKASEDVMAAADPARLRQCLENLVSNAVKHSPAGGAVTVEISRVPSENGECARVEVLDEGPGVPEEVLPHIFERFVTGHRREGGLGLGLYLAKRIAELHGGDLRVERTPGKGARFVLTLRCYDPS